MQSGGETGIRTLEELAPLTVFKTVAFNRSAISPRCGSRLICARADCIRFFKIWGVFLENRFFNNLFVFATLFF